MLKHIYRDIDGTLTDLSAWAPRLEMQSTEKAEEGAVGSWAVTIDDPDGELDFNGHRQYFIEETTSLETDDIVFGGFVAAQDVMPWPGRPLGRVWSLELTDANTFWQRTIMRGTDCNRPAENDVERMAWLLGTTEAALINDTTTYVQSTGGAAMDAHDYRGEYLGQIVADCAMQSGRNWFLWYQKQGDGTRDLIAWYQRDTVAEYLSPLYLTNDITDLELDGLDDGSTLIYPLSADNRLRRDPSRVYCGCYMAFEDGATYRHNATTHAAFAHRDISTTQPHVKTLAKAQARADRMLADLDSQDLRITTSVILPAARVCQLRTGMRVEIRATHWPGGYDDWHYARIVEASPEPISAGREYRVDLELVYPSSGGAADGPPTDYTGTVFAGLARSYATPTHDDPLFYLHEYDTDWATGWHHYPTTGPVAVDQGSAPYASITVSQAFVGRIHARAGFASVFIPPATVTMSLKVNGATIATDSYLTVNGYDGTTLEIDIRDYHFAAGDVISVTAPGVVGPGGWGDSGHDNTFLHVCRGTIVSEADHVSVICTGP